MQRNQLPTWIRPFTTPALEPTRNEWLAIGAGFALYLIAFVLLYSRFGGAAGSGLLFLSFLVLPNALVGWFLGWRAAFASAVVTLLLNFALVWTLDGGQWLVEPSWTIPLALLVVVGSVGAGWLAEQSAEPLRRAQPLGQGNRAGRAQPPEPERAGAELKRQNEYLAALQDTALGLVSRLDVNELLEQIVSRAGALMGTDSGYVFMLDPSSNKLVMRVGVGVYAGLVGVEAQRGVGLAGKVWQTGEPLAVDDYRSWQGRLPDSRRDVLRAVVGLPLRRGQRTADAADGRDTVVGVIGLAHLDDKHTFGASELDVLNRFAALAAVALDNAELYQAARRELTDRVRAEQFLESIIENLPTMLFIKEATELRFVRWNKAGEEITGRSRHAMIGKNDYDFFPPEQVKFFEAKDRETLARGAVIDIPEEPLEIPDGGTRWLHTKKFPMYDADGKPVYLVGISEDITARKQAAARERESEERYRDLFENANDLIQSVNADGRFAYVNRTWKEVLGYTDEELQSLTFLDVIHPDERHHCLEFFGEVMRGKAVPEIETAFLTKDGRKVLIEGSTTPRVVDGKVVSTRGIFRDVTLRHATEQAAAFQNALVKAQYEASPDGILVVGSDDRILSHNGRFAEMWRVPAEALATGQAEVLRQAVRVNLVDVDGWNAKTAAIYRDRTLSTRDEIEFRDGRIIARYSTPVTGSDGEYLGRVWYFQDVTDEQRAAQFLKQQNAYLSALQDTSLGLMGRLDVNALLEDIVARAGALVGTENGYVFLKESDGAGMVMRVGVGAYQGFVGRRAERGVGLAGQVWEKGSPVVVDDYRTWGGRLADPSRDILRAVAGVPLRSGGEVLGVIGLAYLDEAHTFGRAEIQVLERFAQLATIALDNARLYETAQSELAERARAEQALARQLRESELVRRVTAHAVELNIESALKQICADLADYFQVEQSGIALFTEDRRNLTIMADHSPPGAPSVVGGIIPAVGNPSTEIVLETRKPAAFTDAQNDPRLAPIHELMVTRGTASILIAPLFVRDEIIGTVGIDTYTTHEFTQADMDLMERVALSISGALENTRLYRTAQLELTERTRAERETRQRNRELEAISRVSVVMTSELETVPALQVLAREMMQTFRARNCGIALLNRQATELFVVADALDPQHPEYSVGIVIPVVGNPSSEYVIEHAKSLVIVDPQNDPRTEPIHERMRQRGTRCLAIVPLLSAGRVLGTIGLDTTEAGRVFNDAEMRLAETMANQLAATIERQRLFDQTRQRAQELAIVNEMARTLSGLLERGAIFETVYHSLGRLMPTDAFIAWLYDDTSGLLTRPALWDLGVYYSDDEPPHAPAGSVARAIETREAVIINWSREEWQAQKALTETIVGSSEPSASLAFVPLRLGERVRGVISVQSYQFNAYDEPQAALLQTVANHVVTALENAHLFDQSQQALAQSRSALNQLEQAQQRLNLQYQTANLLAEATSFEQSVPDLLEIACAAFGWQLGEYRRVDEDRNVLVFSQLWAGDEERRQSFGARAEELLLASGEGLAGRVWSEGQPLWLAELESSPEFKQPEMTRDAQLASAVAFPLSASERVFGVLTFFGAEPQAADETVMTTMSGVCSQITLFVERRAAEEAVRRQNTYLTALHDTTLGLMRRLDLEELLQNIISRAAELVGTEHGYVHLVEPNGSELQMHVGIGIYHDFVGTRVKPGQGLAGTVWRDRRAIVVDDYRYWEGRLPMVDRDVLRAVVGVPLQSSNQTVGVLGLASLEEGRRFRPDQVEALDRFARLATVALDNAQLFTETRRRMTELDALNRISQAVTSELELDALLTLIGDQLRTIFDVQSVYIALYDPITQLIELPYFLNDNERAHVEPIRYGEGLTSHVIRSRAPLVLNAGTAQQMAELGAKVYGNQAQSYMGVPIFVGDRVTGVISIQSTEHEGMFDESNLRLIETIAATVGSAIQNAQLYGAMQQEVVVRQRAEEEIKLSLREKEVLLKEIHHRVKNNLQIITSLLNLQSSQIHDAETYQMFRESQSRVRSMALIHEKLYQSKDLARIDLDGYVRDLMVYLFRSYAANPDQIRAEINTSEMYLGIDTAIPCGLIISELVTNSLKYAFPDGKRGSIYVGLKPEAGGALQLQVNDTGVGFREGLRWRETDSLGLQLVNTLTAQLHGAMDVASDSGGTRFRITFPG